MHRKTLIVTTLLFGWACNGDEEDDSGTDGDADTDADADTDTDTDVDLDQVPPQGYAAIDPWLDAGSYTDWNCQATPHAPDPVSPHGPNRICSNDLASAHGTGEYPVGAASVKELWDAEMTTVVGYDVASKVSTGGGEAWYWYEQIPPGTVFPGVDIDSNGVVADGLGDGGQELTICVGCHQGAGIDAAHSGHDFVYVQVE
jgi:hypothetical protein